MDKKEKQKLRKEIRSVIVEELNKYLNHNDYQMKYNMLNDLGISEVDMMCILDEVEDRYKVILKVDDLIESTDMTVFDIISHYNEQILKEVIVKKERS